METRFSPALSGALAMVVCGFLWSLAGLFIKVLNWNPFLIAGLRSLIAFLFLLALVGTVRLQWSKALFGAALANAATMLLFVAANKSTTAANAILLQYLAPVFTAAFSVLFLKERLYREQVLALLMTLVGMVVLFLDRLSPGQLAGLIAVIEPVFNPVWVFLVLGETPSANTIAGGALILGSVTAASVISARRAPRYA